MAIINLICNKLNGKWIFISPYETLTPKNKDYFLK